MQPVATEQSKPISRWQGGTYHPLHTHRMLELEGVELASFARRLVAIAVDFIAVVAVFLAVAIPAAKLWEKTHHVDVNLEFKPFENWYSTITPVVYFAVVVWATNGRTIGKWLLGIRIVSLVHERMSLWHSLERALGYGASLLEAGSGFAQYLVHPAHQTVHDRIAETIVIRQRK
ncbi:MAG TPA: RDD family protein [Candidatus Binatia bacterium]|nr:RDD family protein [Candidatus Binatia bacterium]